jgi:molybdate transport system substrate-binding protein
MASEPLAGISSMATRQVLAELAEVHQRRTGQQVAIEAVGGVDAARRVRDGEAFDFVVLAAEAIEQLAAAGRVEAGSRVDLAASGIAIAVKAGAKPLALDSEAAVRDAVLNARSVGFSTGPSGAYLAQLFDRWGIADAISTRLVQARPGVPVGSLVASGDVEIGFQQLSELIHVPGIEVLGPLPLSIQLLTVFSAAVCSASRRRDAAASLLAFLASSEAAEAKRRHGMEPV